MPVKRTTLTDVHKIELNIPGPWLGAVVDFEDTVWWHPILWWWVQIDSMDGEVRKSISYVYGPVL